MESRISSRGRRYYLLAAVLMLLVLPLGGRAQAIRIPGTTGDLHPRIYVTDAEKPALENRIRSTPRAHQIVDRLTREVAPYLARVASDSGWLYSRLQMYWNTHYTRIYVKSGLFDHGSGHAPVPTVRYTGARDAVTAYFTPALADVKPFMDDPRGLYLQGRADKKWAWVEPSKSGRIVEAINLHIMDIARDAAFLYWYTGDERYARLAYPVFDTYMRGMYYREPPVDMNHGHDQTLLGFSAYEVIHDDIVEPLSVISDFLHGYLKARHADQDLYAETFQHWCDQQIANGVPFNNWDMIQARFITYMALALDDDRHYRNGKGTAYYLNVVLNRSSVRQWSLTDLASRGYDSTTGIWYECPGYSENVIGDFTGIANLIDHTLHMDLIGKMPVLGKATAAQAQYLYPNGYIVGFGDTHYGRLATAAIRDMILNADTYHKPGQAAYFSGLLNTLRSLGGASSSAGNPASFQSLFQPPVAPDAGAPAGSLSRFNTATFSAPNVSWFVQRDGWDPYTGLMISEAGSCGNHAHANGIAMELYGKGLPLAPEGGIGTSYFQSDYAEYYSQFPAHNTVVVDGISSYPVMKSYHPFHVLGCYPASGQKSGYFPSATYSDVYFLEPETNSDQRRVMGIIRTGDSTGYYVDIFRSRKKDGGDRKHEYIYHNLGQSVAVYDAAGHRPLGFSPTDKLTFAQGDLMGYDYFFDKEEADFSGDFHALFTLEVPGRKTVYMNMWMEGFPGREIFRVKAPRSTSFRGGLLPPEIEKLPLPTLVVRQKGAAWRKPFVAVYEPGDEALKCSVKAVRYFNDPADSAFAGIAVLNKDGSRQDVFSCTKDTLSVSYHETRFRGTYGVVSSFADGSLQYLFLGSGRAIAGKDYAIRSDAPETSAALSRRSDGLFLTASRPVTLSVTERVLQGHDHLEIAGKKQAVVRGRRVVRNGQPWRVFVVPAMPETRIRFIP